MAIQELPPVAARRSECASEFTTARWSSAKADRLGDAVNLAARLAGLAAKGQIMTSRETVDRMTPTQKAFRAVCTRSR
jgi:adenylate cyclase